METSFKVPSSLDDGDENEEQLTFPDPVKIESDLEMNVPNVALPEPVKIKTIDESRLLLPEPVKLNTERHAREVDNVTIADSDEEEVKVENTNSMTLGPEPVDLLKKSTENNDKSSELKTIRPGADHLESFPDEPEPPGCEEVLEIPYSVQTDVVTVDDDGEDNKESIREDETKDHIALSLTDSDNAGFDNELNKRSDDHDEVHVKPENTMKEDVDKKERENFSRTDRRSRSDKPRSRRSDRSRSRRHRSRRRDRSGSHESRAMNIGDFVVVDETENEEGVRPPGEEGVEDIAEVEVIKSNLARAEKRRRSRSRHRSSRRRSRSARRSRERERMNRRLRVMRVERESKLRKEDERERMRQWRKDNDWKKKSDAFIASLGVNLEPLNFSVPPPVLPSLVVSDPPYLPPDQAPEWEPQDHNMNSPTPSLVSCRSLSSDHPDPHLDQGHKVDPGASGSTGQDLDFRYRESLKPGNHLLATWDMLAVGGGLESSIYQLGCHTALGDSFLKVVLPQDPSQVDEARANLQCPLLELSGSFFVRHPLLGQFISCVTEKEAMEDFIKFLNTGLNRVRPAYDGTVLVSHIVENIPQLLKSMKRWGLYDKFVKTVSSMGDVVTYLATQHSEKFSDSHNVLKVSLDAAYETTFRRKVNMNSVLCEVKARMSHEVLVRLLGGGEGEGGGSGPNFSNFFKPFSHPLTSQKMQQLLNYRTVREKQELFRPLEIHIAKELAGQQGELFLSGLYAASEREEEEQKTQYQVVASAMCRILIQAGFQFDQLLVLAKERGIAELELQLRTSFLGLMAGQSRQVVDQTIRTTRLVVSYFARCGHLPLETLLSEAKESDKTEENLVPSPAAGPSSSTQEGIENVLEKFEPLRQFISRTSNDSRRRKESGQDALPFDGRESVAVECLVELGFTEKSLGEFFSQDLEKKKIKPGYNHSGFRYMLRNKLDTVKGTLSKNDMEVKGVVQKIVDYYSSQADKKKVMEEFEPLKQFILRTTTGGERVGVELAVRCLVDVGVTEKSLGEFFSQDSEQNKNNLSWNHLGFKHFLKDKLDLVTVKYGQNINMEGLVNKITVYYSSSRQRLLVSEQMSQTGPAWYTCPLCGTQGHWMVHCKVSEGQFDNVKPGDMEESYLKDTLTEVEMLFKRQGFELYSIYSSLLAVKQFVTSKIGPECLATGGTEGQVEMVGELVQKLLSFTKLSHFRLKNEFDEVGEAAFRRGLWIKLARFEKNLPHGVNLDTFVNWVLEYFGQFLRGLINQSTVL